MTALVVTPEGRLNPNAMRREWGGEPWPSYRTGIGRYERRTVDGRCRVGSNASRSTYWAVVDGVGIGYGFRYERSAAAAALAQRAKNDKAGAS